MKQIERMKNLSGLITSQLEKFYHLRDNDNRLIATIWSVQMGGKETLKTITALELLQLYAEGRLSSTETIRRCRQKLQELNPLLRGDTWCQRQSEGKQFAKEI